MFMRGKKTRHFRGIVALLMTVMLAAAIAPGAAFAEGDDGVPLVPFAGEGETGVPDTGWYTASPSSPTFVINTADELAGLAQIVNGTASGISQFGFSGRTIGLGDDIDISCYGDPENEDISIGGIAVGWNSGKGWVPIGTSAFPFKGAFEGGGHTVDGLYINDEGLLGAGLFGYVEGGSLSGIGVSGSVSVGRDFFGQSFVGGVVGYLQSGNVDNCYSAGDVSGEGENAGGVAGYVFDGSVTNCHAAGSVSGASYVGGVVGHLSGGSAANCYSTGDVDGLSYTGGVVGGFFGSSIENCYSEGDVSGTEYVGGVVGDFSGDSIESCYSISGISGEQYVGGIVGYFSGDWIENCYTAGEIKGTGAYSDSIGGIAGSAYGDLANCYSLGAVSGELQIGGIAGSAYGDLTDCYSLGAVSGANQIGGIAGALIGSSIENSYSAGSVSGNSNVGGIVGDLVGDFGAAAVSNSAALNPSVSASGSSASVGRIVGESYGTNTLSGNVAFGGMAVTAGGSPKAISNSLISVDGLSRTGAELQAASGFPAAFAANPWTYTAGYLPGLGAVEGFPATVDMPAHLVLEGTAPAITTDSLPGGTVGVAYAATLMAAGADISWSVAIGSLPAGLSLNASNGEISGIPESVGVFGFTIEASNAAGSDTKALTIAITAPSVGEGTPDTGWYTTDPTPVDNTFAINTAYELAGLAQIVNGTAADIAQFGFSGMTIALGDDIDLSSYGEGATGWNDGKGWVPIGTEDNPFEGTFDGGGHAINGLYINVFRAENPIGLFGWLDGGTVKSLDTTGVDIGVIFASFIGVIAGYVENNSGIINCYTSGSVKGPSRVGGVAGAIVDTSASTSSSVIKCASDCNVGSGAADSIYIGGIAGFVSHGIIDGCYSTGNISGVNGVGGIVGYVTNNSVLDNCYSTGMVSGADSIGGIAGYLYSDSSITDCYSAGAVSGASAVGGIAGVMDYDFPSIEKSYSTSNVSASKGSAGGIVGLIGQLNNTSLIASLKNCAALNPRVSAGAGSVGRVAGSLNGSYTLYTLSGNISFDEMKVEANNVNKTIFDDLHGLNGQDVSREKLQAPSGFAWDVEAPGGPWTYEPGKLPGLFGSPVEMPVHLSMTPDSPVITTMALENGLVGAMYSKTIAALGDMPVFWSIVSGGLPAGLTLNGTTGEISGTPTATGKHYFTVQASNSSGNDTAVLYIIVSRGETSTPDTDWYSNDPSADTFSISTADELAGLAQIVNGTASGIARFAFQGRTIVLEEDIDISAYGYGVSWNESKGWVPIGISWDRSFRGAVRGNGHIISGLYIDDVYLQYAGLFGYMPYGEMQDFGLVDVDIKAAYGKGGYTGGVIAYLYDGSVANCNVSGFIRGYSNVGGVAGYSYGGVMNNCYNAGEVSGEGENVGGVAGSGGGMNNCYSSGNVNGMHDVGGVVGHGNNITDCYSTGDVSGDGYVGGVVGYGGGILTNCYSTGTITCADMYVGGVLGIASGQNSGIINCYSTGDVSGGSFTAGIVGHTSGVIENCWATGDVSGDGYVGGIVGEFSGETIENCYSEGDVSGGVGPVGGIVGLASRMYGLYINNCYSTGDISGTAYIGGVVGCFDGESVERCYSAGAVSGIGEVGGIVGGIWLMYSSGSNILDCAALNPSISASGSSAAVGRIVGRVDGAPAFSGNVAFGGMVFTEGGNSKSAVSGLTSTDGLSRSKAELQKAAGFPGALTKSPWTYVAGMLPGLSGIATEMPKHLRMIDAPLVYSAKAGPSEGVFATALYGYGSVPIIIFIVENTGTGNISELAMSLGGSGSGGGGLGSFEIMGGLPVALSPGQKATVGVRPKGGLEAGAYTDTFIVTGSNGIGLNVPLSFTVEDPVFSFGTTQADEHLDFGSAEAGYNEQEAQAFTVASTGTGTITSLAAALGGADASCFEINAGLSVTTLAPKGTASVSVRPKDGLPAGEYTDAHLLITGDNGLSLAVALSFKVTPREDGRGIIRGKDNFSFPDHRYDFFDYSMALRGPYDELINRWEYLSALKDAFGGGDSGGALMNSYMYEVNEDGEIEPILWGGADFGMAAVVALAKMGRLDPGLISKDPATGQPAKGLYQMKTPKQHKTDIDSETTANLVTYYTLLQFTPRTLSARDQYSEEDTCRDIVSALNEGESPVVIGFEMLEGIGGPHVVVGDGITFNEAESRYEISIWDPYKPDSQSNTLYITDDFRNGGFKEGSESDEIRVYEGKYYQDEYQYNPSVLRYVLTVEEGEDSGDESKRYFYPNIQEYLSAVSDIGPLGLSVFSSIMPASATEETSITTNYGDFILASTGKSAVVADGIVASGDLAISDGVMLFEKQGAKYRRYIVPALPLGETYTLVPNAPVPDGGAFETSVFYDNAANGFFSRIIAGAEGGYVFGADGEASVDFGLEPQKATIQLALNDKVSDLYTASVTTEDTGFSLGPSPDADTIAVALFSGSSPGSAAVRLLGDINSMRFDDVQKGTGFYIKDIDGEIVLVGMDNSPIDRGEIGFSVVFITKGGTSYEALANIAAGEAIESPGKPVKAGHTFGGWYLDAAFTESCTFPLQIMANTKIYAKWTANRYAVTYNANGGKFTSGSLAGEKTVKRAEVFGADYAVGLGMPERAGYRFLGWNTAKDVKKGSWVYRAGERPKASKATMLKNHTVYAIWQPKDGAVFLNENYGGAQDVYFSHIPHGKAYGVNGKLKKPAARPGFTFGGWYKKNAAGALKTKVTDKTKMSGGGSVTLYAKWTAKKVTVTMNLNQKSVNPSKKSTTKKVSKNYGSLFAGLAIPALTGARFVKWTADPEGAVDLDASIEPAANAKGVFAVTVYAQYEALPGPQIAYTVRLDPNGGRASAASIAAIYQKSPQLRYSGLASYDKNALNAPVRDGYTFAGWYTAKKGGSKVTANSKVTKYKDHTLYARWKANKYWVAFDLGGGKAGGKSSVAHKRYAYGAKYKSFPAPSKTGHKFLGWYMDPGVPGSKVTKSSIVADYAGWPVSGSDSSSSKASKASPTVTLTALFEPKAYKATFSANGGNFGVSAVKTLRLSETYGGAYILPPQPTRTGYTFVGWYTKKSGGKMIDEGKVELKKVTTLYAHWVKA